MKELKQHIIAAGIIALLTGIFFKSLLSRTRTFVTTGLIQSDLMNLYFPAKAVYAEKLREGTFPFWEPNISAGRPLIAEGQLGAFYPFHLLFFRLFSIPLAFNLCVLFHFFLAGFFSYLLINVGFDRSFLSSVFGGVTVAFSGFMVSHLTHLSMLEVVAWLPLLILLLICSRVKFSLLLVLGGGLITCLQFLIGHVEVLYFSAVLLTFFSLVYSFFSYQKKGFSAFYPLLFLFLSFSVGGVLSALQLVPSLELANLSVRGKGVSFQQASDYLFPLRSLLYMLFPFKADFSHPVVLKQGVGRVSVWETYGYVGILPLIFSLVSLFLLLKKAVVRKSKVKNSKFLWTMAFLLFVVVFSFLFCLGQATPVFELFWRIVPFMRLFQYPTRMIIFVTLGIAILSAFGIDWLLPRFISNKRWLVTIFCFLIAVSFADLYRANSRPNPTANYRWWKDPVASVSFLQDNLGRDWRYHTLGTSSFDYALTANLDVQKELQLLAPFDFNLLYDLPAVDGSPGLSLYRSSNLSALTTNSFRWANLSDSLAVTDTALRLLSLRSARFVLTSLPFSHPGLTLVEYWPFSSPLKRNVYVQEKGGLVKIIGQQEVSGVYMYENTQALPRARFVSDEVYVEDGVGALQIMKKGEIDFGETVLLEETDAELRGRGTQKDAEGEGGRSDCSIVKDTDQEVVVEVNAPKEGYLVLSDTWYPGWRATVTENRSDETDKTYPVEILRANYNFRAVRVGEGESKVTFRYEPRSVKVGGMISLVSFGIWVSLAVYSYVRRN